MRTRLTSVALPYGLLILVVAVFYWKALFLGELFLTNDVSGSDMLMHAYPARAEMAEALRGGRFPLWTDNVFLGFPVAAEGQSGAFYPPNVLSVLALPVHWAFTGLLVLHVMLAGLFTALYARSLGRSRPASALSAVTVSLSCFWVGHLKHVNLLASAAWVPLLFWLVERWSRRADSWRPGVWLGAVLALMVVAGHVQTAYNALLVIAVYVLGAAAAEGLGRRSWRPVRVGAGVLVIMTVAAVGLSAVQISLTREYTALGTRSGGLTYEEATEYDYTVADLATFVDPYRFGDPGRGTYVREDVPRIFWENCAYVGILPLILAVVGAILCWRQRRVKWLVGLALVSILVALGRGSPVFAALFRFVPGFDRFRFPQRFLLFATLSLGVLAAFGVDGLAARLRSSRRVLLHGAVLLLTLVNLFLFGYTHNPTLPAGEWLVEPESVRFLERDPSRFRVWSPDAYLLHLQAYRKAGGWKGDLTPYLEQRNALQPNLSGLWGIESAGMYFPSAPELFLDSTTGLDLEPPVLWRMLDLYNVKYVLAARDIDDPRMALVDRAPGGVRIYENGGVLPRARVVPVGIPVASPAQALAVITGPGFDPEAMVTLEGWDGRGGGGPAEGCTVEETARRPGRVELYARLTSPGFLVLSDAFYPGWEVWVDGARGAILQANICCRAVALGPGEHRVVFRYWPRSFRTGLAVSFAALAMLGAIAGWELARRKGERA